MVLGSGDLRMLIQSVFGHNDEELINPASVDIRIGQSMLVEADKGSVVRHQVEYREWAPVDLRVTTEQNPFMLRPGQFVLISTYEHIKVPSNLVMELRLKSSRAREGYNHSLAFWVDPGWEGILTMEVTNVRQYKSLPLWYGMRFAQAILAHVTEPVDTYLGKYQYANKVEESK